VKTEELRRQEWRLRGFNLQRIWRDGVGTMGRIWDAAFSEQVANVDDVPIDVVDLVFDRCRGRGRQRGRNGGPRDRIRPPRRPFATTVSASRTSPEEPMHRRGAVQGSAPASRNIETTGWRICLPAPSLLRTDVQEGRDAPLKGSNIREDGNTLTERSHGDDELHAARAAV